MSFQTYAVALALVAAVAAPTSAWAFGGGGPGCSDLPEYDRAVGTLQGLSVCDMTVEQARRIVYGAQAAAAPPAGPVLHHHRHHRVRPVQPRRHPRASG